MIGYGQQGPVQFPTPGDEDKERRAAEEYDMRRRARRRILWIALALVVVVAAVGVVYLLGLHNGLLTYRFEASSGHVKIVLTDDRSGKHTTWVTIRNAQGKLVLQGLASFRDGADGGSQTVSTNPALPAGTYTYAVYDIGGIHYTIDRKGGPAKDRIASGTVSVP